MLDFRLAKAASCALLFLLRRLCSGAQLTTSLNLSQHLTSLKPANKLFASRFHPVRYSIFPGRACASAWNENYTEGKERKVGGPVNARTSSAAGQINES